MLWLAATAALAAPIEPQLIQRGATAHAMAVVRVVSGVRLKLDSSDNPGAPLPRRTQVTTKDGTVVRAQLIEFE